jgi:cell division cycle 14
MKHYKFNAAHYIGWARLCRPGSVLGAQQFFLNDYEDMLQKSGESSPVRKQIEQLFID